MAEFDSDTLRWLRAQQEVTIRTARHPDAAVIVWIVVADDNEVYLRSVKGAKGRWYRDLAANGSATLELMGKSQAVEAVPAVDAGSVERVSREYLAKYRHSPYADSMVRAEVLPTTLRVKPG